MLYTPRPSSWEDDEDFIYDDGIYDREDDADPGDMDGDAASALASAGWGTDEDYSGYEDAMWD